MNNTFIVSDNSLFSVFLNRWLVVIKEGPHAYHCENYSVLLFFVYFITAVETTESEVKKCLVQAYEMYGDTLMLRGKYEEASDLYNSMFKNCDRYVHKFVS